MEFTDINWQNCFRKKTINKLLNFFYRILIFLLMIVITSPGVIFNVIQQNKIWNEFESSIQTQSTL